MVSARYPATTTTTQTLTLALPAIDTDRCDPRGCKRSFLLCRGGDGGETLLWLTVFTEPITAQDRNHGTAEEEQQAEPDGHEGQ